MEVEECKNTKTTTVKYFSKHCGHTLDEGNLKYNRICRSDKDKIAGKKILLFYIYVWSNIFRINQITFSKFRVPYHIYTIIDHFAFYKSNLCHIFNIILFLQ